MIVSLSIEFNSAISNAPESVDEIIVVENIPRFSYTRVRDAILRWWVVLKKDGTLSLSTNDAADNFVELLQECGFVGTGVSRITDWRMLITARKTDYYDALRPSWDMNLSAGETVLEVGPGAHPFVGATQYFDIRDDFPRELHGKPIDIGRTVEDLPYKDKQFDVVIASHVLEHVEHPDVALAELQRVAHRGVIECPAAAKDWILQEGHVHNKWQVTQTGNTLVFVALSADRLGALSDETIRNFMFRVTQYPTVESYLGWALRRLFWQSNHFLNLVVHWDAHTPVKVVVVR